jgi:hypothetical protein
MRGKSKRIRSALSWLRPSRAAVHRALHKARYRFAGVQEILMKPHLLACAVLASSAWVCVPSLAQGADAATTETRAVRLLPYDVSRSLKIIKTPTTQPAPLVVGVYWACQDGGNGSAICRLVTVVCTNDQSQCAEV